MRNLTILLVGANSALSESLIPILSREHKVIRGARKNADCYIDLEKDVNIPSGIDVIINVAAFFDNDTDNIVISYETNTIGLLKLCLEAKKHKIKHFIQVSSTSANVLKGSPFYTQYAISKRHAEEIVKHYCDINEIPLAIIRPSQIYGESDSFRKNQPLFYSMMDKAEKGDDILIYGSRNPLRNFIHADDVASCICEVINQNKEGIFSCMYPKDTSFVEIAETAFRVFNSGGNILFDKEKDDIPDSIFEIDLSLYNTISRFPKIDLETGIKMIKKFRSEA